MYHYVRDTWQTPYPDLKALSVADFHAQLDWLQSHYNVIDYFSFENALRGGRTSDGACALLTFDDGFRDHYSTVFPLLKERGLSGVFFVVGSTIASQPRLLDVHKTHFLLAKLDAKIFTAVVKRVLAQLSGEIELDEAQRAEIYRYDCHKDLDVKRLLNYELPFSVSGYLLNKLFEHHIGGTTAFAEELYLTTEMIKEMAAAGMTFGFHTENHRTLSRLSYDEQYHELGKGVELIRSLTGQLSVPFCYPYGHTHTYNSDTLAILMETSYSTAFNVVRRLVRLHADSRYELPRFDTKDLSPFTEAIPDA